MKRDENLMLAPRIMLNVLHMAIKDRKYALVIKTVMCIPLPYDCIIDMKS